VAIQVKNLSCVTITNKQRSYAIDRDKIAHIASEISTRLGVNHYEVCVTFVSAAAMRELNQKFRGKDKSTDVLSFPQYQWKRPLKVRKTPPENRPILNPMPLGDIIVSPADAEENAARVRTTFDREICFLLVHGILHLVGHDHMKPGEKKIMFTEQKKLMRVFAGTSRRDPLWAGCARKKSRNTKQSINKKRKSSK
jgi:probable rRNA maturation factor